MKCWVKRGRTNDVHLVSLTLREKSQPFFVSTSSTSSSSLPFSSLKFMLHFTIAFIAIEGKKRKTEWKWNHRTRLDFLSSFWFPSVWTSALAFVTLDGLKRDHRCWIQWIQWIQCMQQREKGTQRRAHCLHYTLPLSHWTCVPFLLLSFCASLSLFLSLSLSPSLSLSLFLYAL